MRHRDAQGYQHHKNKLKYQLMVIRFEGWFLADGTEWEDDPRKVPERKQINLCYTMWNDTSGKFARIPFKRAKRVLQWSKFRPLDDLVKNQHYVVYTEDVTHELNIDKWGDWYWHEAIPVSHKEGGAVRKLMVDTNGPSDQWLPLELIELTIINGHPHGRRIFDEAHNKFGKNPRTYEYVMAQKFYWDTQPNPPKKILEKIDKILQQYKADELLT